jgi:SRSO17 transposase
MDLPKSGDATSRFLAFVEGLTSVIGHADRAKPLRDYCIGLMMPGERKSVEPMAAITAPERTAAQHQSLLHFVGEGTWSDEKVLAKVREMVLPEIERHGPIEAWIIDDTGFPKKGRHSVGVGRQYCGELGKQDNCQIAVTLSIANHHASLPAAYRLYLPKEWATDRTRRRKAGVPKEITFKTKPAIALEQLRWACVAGLPRGVVLMDAGYGAYTDLRTNITALGLSYVAGIMPQTSVWAPGTGPQPPKAWSGCGRPPKLLRRDGKHQPISVKKLAFGLPSKAWRKITWREATAEPLSSRFARVRVRAAHRDYWHAESRPEEWLLIEWPEGEEAPTKYWLCRPSTTRQSVSGVDRIRPTGPQSQPQKKGGRYGRIGAACSAGRASAERDDGDARGGRSNAAAEGAGVGHSPDREGVGLQPHDRAAIRVGRRLACASRPRPATHAGWT